MPKVRFLKEKNSGVATVQDFVTVRDGSYMDDLPIRTNDVYLVVLTRVAEN